MDLRPLGILAAESADDVREYLACLSLRFLREAGISSWLWEPPPPSPEKMLSLVILYAQQQGKLVVSFLLTGMFHSKVSPCATWLLQHHEVWLRKSLFYPFYPFDFLTQSQMHCNSGNGKDLIPGSCSQNLGPGPTHLCPPGQMKKELNFPQSPIPGSLSLHPTSLPEYYGKLRV